jgi:signal transduction histidine kinase
MGESDYPRRSGAAGPVTPSRGGTGGVRDGASPTADLRIRQIKEVRRHRKEGTPRTNLPPPEIIVLLDKDARVVRAVGRHMGTRLSELAFLPGRIIHDVIHPECGGNTCDLAQTWDAAWHQHLDGLPVEWELISHLAGGVFKLRLQAVDYACGPLYRQVQPDDRAHSVLIIQDISAVYGRRRSDMSRAEIGRRASRRPAPAAPADERRCDIAVCPDLTISRDLERNRIATELHDGLGQIFSLLRYEFESYLDRLSATGDLGNDPSLRRIYHYVLDSLAELRQVTRGLKPATLNQLGLEKSLELLCEETQAACPGIAIDTRIQVVDGELPGIIILAIYRICQEALNNILRHARATEASLTIAASAEGIELSICDNGIGLDPGMAGDEMVTNESAGGVESRSRQFLRSGFGISSMRQRTAGTGGEFSFRAKPGEGCSISARWDAETIRLLS